MPHACIVPVVDCLYSRRLNLAVPFDPPSEEASHLVLRVLQLQVGYEEGGAGRGTLGRGLRGAGRGGGALCGLEGGGQGGRETGRVRRTWEEL